MKRLGWIGLGVVALVTFFGGGWLLRRGLEARGQQPEAPTGAPAAMDSRLFREVVRNVRSFAVDSLEESVIYRLAASGMLNELDDPYAAIIGSTEEPEPDLAVSARGMYLDLEDELVTVVAVIPGSPAAMAGIRGGDALLEVGGRSTEGLRPVEIAASLGRDLAAEVPVRLGREGVAPLRVSIPAAPVPPIAAPALDDGRAAVAHLRIRGLRRTTASEASDAIETAVRRGATGLVLDLRGAVEGDLDDAAALAGLFLPRGATVVVTRRREPLDSMAAVVDREPDFPDLPVVVLVDRGTAGAAEVVAGALQDHDRALIVGETSFGRGSSVSHFPLGEGSWLRLTTAVWYTPGGRMVQRPGVAARDTTAENGRPEFRTAGGRVVWGGGGVVPDREVDADVGDVPNPGQDPALGLARKLLAQAPTTQALLAPATR